MPRAGGCGDGGGGTRGGGMFMVVPAGAGAGTTGPGGILAPTGGGGGGVVDGGVANSYTSQNVALFVQDKSLPYAVGRHCAWPQGPNARMTASWRCVFDGTSSPPRRLLNARMLPAFPMWRMSRSPGKCTRCGILTVFGPTRPVLLTISKFDKDSYSLDHTLSFLMS